MSKTILVITDNLRNQINGVVTTFKNIEDMARNDGHNIVYLDPGQFHYCDCPGYADVKLSWPRQIGKKIKAMEPDYIHIATEGPLGLASRLWLDSKGWRYNTSYHTKFPEFLKTIYGIPEFLTYAYVRWFHKHSGRVLTTTKTMVADLKAHGFSGEVIPWTRGVDRTFFKDDLRGETIAGRPILLSVGRVSKEKGLDDFCQLDYPGSTKIVVGDGPYRAELKARYPDVHFTGAKSGIRLATYFANADVFVFTSRVDTFGIVIIEALSVGTPVAAYPVPGPLDILDSTTGVMNEDLKLAVRNALMLDREQIQAASHVWTWDECWKIFKNSLVEII